MPEPASPRPSRLWLLVLGLALVETVGSVVVRARVVETDDWGAAVARVRSEWRDGDALVSAPRWTDPLLREAAADLLDLHSAGRSDLEGARRLWSLSIRGHRAEEAPPEAPELRENVGRVLVERWTLPGRPIGFDFVARAEDATFSEGERDCHRGGGGHARGLGEGPASGPDRVSCGAGWAGETVIEDLEFRARHCVLQPPGGREPVRARWDDVPLGERIVIHGGVHWVDERHATVPGGHGATVTLVVRAGETELLRAQHRDGDGWSRWERDVPEALRGTRAAVTVETTADRPVRWFCWAGETVLGAGGAIASAEAGR